MVKSVYVPRAGGIIDFPDEATPQQMLAYIDSTYGAPAASPAPAAAGPDDSGLLDNFAYSFATGLTNIPGGIASLLYPAEEADKTAAGRFSENSRKYLEETFGIDPTKERTTGQMLAGGVGSLASFLVPGLGAGKVLGLAGAGARAARLAGAATASGQGAAIGAEARSERIRDQLESGMEITPDQQLQAQRLDALVGLSEGLPLGRVFGPLNTILSKVPASKADIVEKIIANRLSRVVGTGAAEGLQEALSGVANDLVEANVYNPDVQIGEDILSNAGVGAFSGSLLEGVIQLAAGRKLRAARQLKQDIEDEKRQSGALQRNANINSVAEDLRQYNVEGPVSIIEDEIEGGSAYTIKAKSGNMFGVFYNPDDAKQAIETYKQRTGAKISIAEPVKPPRAFPVKINEKEFNSIDEIIAERDSAVSVRDDLAGIAADPVRLKAQADIEKVSPDYYQTIVEESVKKQEKVIAKFDDFLAMARGEKKPAKKAKAATTDTTEPVAEEPVITEEDVNAPVDEEAPVAEMPVEESRVLEEATPPTETLPEAEPLRTELRSTATADQVIELQAELFGAPKNVRDMTPEERATYEAERDRRYPPEEVPIYYDASPAPDARPRRLSELQPNPRAETPEYKSMMEAVYTGVESRLKGIVPADLRLKQSIADKPGYILRGAETTEQTPDGTKSVIELATQYFKPNATVEEMVRDLIGTLNHEIIHVLRTEGRLRPAEWKMLSRAAANTKVPGKRYTYLDKATAIYEPMGGIYSNPEEITEEAVAEMYKDWVAGKNNKEARPVGGLFNRITEFLRRIFRALKASRYEEVFKRIESGEMKTRERGPGREADTRFSAAKVISAKTMVELREKIYKAEGWQRKAGESQAKRINEAYDVEFDQKNNRIIATKKGDADRFSASPTSDWETGGAPPPGVSSVNRTGGSPYRISQRRPTSVKTVGSSLRDNLFVDVASMKLEPGVFEHNIDIVNSYPGFKVVAGERPEQTLKRFKKHVVDNLLWLHDTMDPALRQRAKLWYDGARKITDTLAAKYDLPDTTVAAVLAGLSPQKDWFQNVSLAERLIDIVMTKRDVPFDDDMVNYAMKIGAVAEYAPMLQAMRGMTLNDMKSQNFESFLARKHNEILAGVFNAEQALKIVSGDVTLAKAIFVRVFDEMNNPRSYSIITPEGDKGAIATTAKGKASNVAWGSFTEIGKGVNAIDDGTKESIDVLLGDKHKIRNFYNNIISPKSKDGSVTIDTHAVAAALLRALAGKSVEVHHNFGTSVKGMTHRTRNSSVTGVHGLYAIYADAYREAAKLRGILPREMQSITWEAVRGLYKARFKGQKSNVQAIDDIWRLYSDGKITANEARKRVLGFADPGAEGINSPFWKNTPSSVVYGVGGPPLNTGGVRAAGLRKAAGRTGGGGTGTDAGGSKGTRSGVRFSASPVEERDAAFQRLADGQRYLPEYAMLDVQNAMGGGVISHATEHLGDLTHRMSEKFSYLEGQQGIVDQKVSSVLRVLKNPYGFAREFEENIRSNAAFHKTTPEKVREAVWKALDVYAAEHAKLEVFNEPQRLARDAAVALGRRNYTEAIRLLEKLKVYSGGDPDAYKAAVGEYNPPSPDGVRFAAAPALDTDEFKRWFRKSKVVNEDGTPKVVYHGTSARVRFTTFDTAGSELGSHFGTSKQSNKFVHTGWDEVRTGGRIYPVYLSIQNPLRLRDFGNWDNDKVASQLLEMGMIDQATYDSMVPDYGRGQGDFVAKERANREKLQKIIRNAGYDGIVYLNRFEGLDADPEEYINVDMKDDRELNEIPDEDFKRYLPEAEDSYIIFAPTQAKSIFNEFKPGEARRMRFSAAPLPAYIETRNDTLFAPPPKEGFFNWISNMFLGPPTQAKMLNMGGQNIEISKGKMRRLKLRTAAVDDAAFVEELEKQANLANTGNYERLTADYSAIVAIGLARRATQLGASLFMKGKMVLDYARPGDLQSATMKVVEDPDSMKEIIKVLMQPGPVDSRNNEHKDKREIFRSYASAMRARNLKAMGIRTPNELDDQYINTVIPFTEREYPEVVEAYKRYQRFNRNLLQTAKEAGLIDDVLYQKWIRNMDYYGFYREVFENIEAPGTPTKLASKFEMRPMKGSEHGDLVNDPIYVMVHNAQFWVSAIAKNLAAKKSFTLARDMGVARMLAPNEKPDRAQGEEEQVMFFRENGIQRRFAVSDPMLVTALGSDDRGDVGRFFQIMGMPTQILRETVTRDPGFMIANLMRDTLSAWITSGADITPFIGTAKGFAKAYKNSASYQALMGRGIVGSYDLAMRPVADVAAELRRRAMPSNVLTLNGQEAATAVVRGLWNRLGALSEYSDAATRIAVYEAAKAQGMSDAEAAFRAIEILDFSRRGGSQAISILTKIIPFLNARIQGLDVLYQAGKAGVKVATGRADGDRERDLGKKFLVRGGMLAAISMFLEWLNEDDEDYKQLDNYIKDSNLLIPLKMLGLEGQFLAVPKPFEAGLLFSTLPQQLYKSLISGDASTRDNVNMLVMAVGSTFGINPIPQAILPVVEIITNHDFYTGLPLISEGKARLSPELQYNSGTSQLAMMLGKIPIWYNFDTGRFEGQSPIVIDQLIGGYGGPLGTYLAQIVGMSMQAAEMGPERLPMEMTQLPVVKRFFLDAEKKNPKVVTQAYELFRIVDEANRSFSRLRQTGDAEATLDYLEENKDILSYKKYVFKLVDRLNKLSAHERAIERDKTMTDDEKREAMKRLREVRIRLASKVGEINEKLGR